MRDQKAPDHPQVIAPPPLIFGVPLVLLLWAHDRLSGTCDIPVHLLNWPIRAFFGAATVIAGAILMVTALAAFKRADTPPEPWKATRALTLAGPYRLTRNPMYLGMAFAYAGIGIIAGCLMLLGSLVLVLIVIDRLVIDREEAYLAHKFGQPYTDYLARSKRWF
ncbi:methyltransferase family protein [Sphingomicrobium arenosum]|uniref:methyltransferase family protein n=1 Tax=Sphingomicrobium arenosum TaxID=2233861 RepID=UPI0022407585|nr:isoprenylcysteine carboxylmethyltransferase family protein [Sphingomicrobium arenosum]